MTILVIEFLGLIIICYIFFVYATRNEIGENKGRMFPGKALAVIILTLFSFVVFASWYVSLGLT